MSMLPPIGRQRLRAALASRGAAPRKRHGQHFLLDDNLLAAIVRAASVVPGQRVLEVGPGPGLLTRHLLAAGADVVAIEIDRVMGAVASELLGPVPAGRLTWIEADALAGGRRLGPELERQLPGVEALVANLPYGIAGPLLGSLAVHPDGPPSQVVMIQREMGRRLAALPGSRDYGPLGVIMGLCAEVQILRKVPPGAFWPPPKVESVVARIELKADRPPGDGLMKLRRFLAAAFHNRRKTLWNSLMEAGDPAVVQEISTRFAESIEKRQRAEQLEPLQLYALAQHWPGTPDVDP